jgi:hypothetical protein
MISRDLLKPFLEKMRIEGPEFLDQTIDKLPCARNQDIRARFHQVGTQVLEARAGGSVIGNWDLRIMSLRGQS